MYKYRRSAEMLENLISLCLDICKWIVAGKPSHKLYLSLGQSYLSVKVWIIWSQDLYEIYQELQNLWTWCEFESGRSTDNFTVELIIGGSFHSRVYLMPRSDSDVPLRNIIASMYQGKNNLYFFLFLTLIRKK